MLNLIFAVAAGAELLALVLRFTARRAFAAWVLALGTLPALAQMTIEFSEDFRRGAPMTDSDWGFLAAELAVLAMALLSALLCQKRFPALFFWLGWGLNLALTGLFVYLVFFFRIF